MRIYTNWKECYEETRRDLAEMGIDVFPKTMQDKNIEGNLEYATKELQNYSYCLLDVKSSEYTGVTQPWADAEFLERVNPSGNINPGDAWKLRPDVWNEFMHDGKMAYSYNERFFFNDQLNKIIDRLKNDHDSRQLWLSVWNPAEDPDKLGGISRVPCSIGYNFQFREGKLNIHYVMRSCDFKTHFVNDSYLAAKLLEYVADRTELPTGNLTHTMFSLHIYRKDVQGVF